jgi:hypothetical protein
MGGVVIKNCFVEFNTDVTLPYVTLQALARPPVAVGGISGSGTLTISNQLTWISGYMTGSGETNITSDALVEFVSKDAKALARSYNNYGKSLWTDISRIERGNDENFYVPAANADAALSGAQSAWSTYQGAIDSARTTLASAEDAANSVYVTAEAALNTQYFGDSSDLKTADDQYTQDVADAEAAHDPGDPVSDEQYYESLAAAQDSRDQAVDTAVQTYAQGEIGAYNSYLSSWNSARTAYQTSLSTAFTNYRQALKNAAGLAPYSSYSSAQLAQYIHDVLYNQVPTIDVPLDHLGPPNPDDLPSILTNLSADVRNAVAGAYFAQFGAALADDIQAQLSSLDAQAALSQLYYGDSSNSTSDATLSGLQGWVDQAGTWLNNTVASAATSLQSTSQSLVDYATNDAWDDVLNTANSTWDMMRNDPVQFLQTASMAYVNTQAVMANQFTFGLIPGLNSYSDNLVNTSGYYRAVQIGAIVAREAGITFLTGGTGLVAGGTIRGLSLAARYVGPVASRAALRFVFAQGGAGAVRATVSAVRTIACVATTAQRAAQPAMLGMQMYQSYQNVNAMQNAIAAGDYEGAARLAGQTAGGMPSMLAMGRDTARMINAFRQGGPSQLASYLAACFTGETPIYAKRGWIRFDELTAQDEVLARSESDPNGPLEFKRVEEVFRTIAPIWHLHLKGEPDCVSARVLRTTSEHPFWVKGKGWTAAKELQEGDLLSSHDGQWIAVEECMDAGYAEAVYNCRVAEFATYFVGDFEEWGFSVWAHNACIKPIVRPGMQVQNITVNGKTVRVLGTAQVVTTNPGHADEVMREVRDLISRRGGSIDSIVLNRSIRTATGIPSYNTPGANLRPDITVNWKDGKVQVFEVGSPGQSDRFLRDQMQRMMNSLPGVNRGEATPPTLFGDY